MRTRTPREINKHIRRLLNKVAQGQIPVYLPVTPTPQAMPNECFQNVEANVLMHGGETIYGWLLWEWPHVLVEAEFHAVWRNLEGELVEITPKPDGDSNVLFLPDPLRRYQGRQVDNVRLAVRDDLLVHHFIRNAGNIFSIMKRGERADVAGYVTLPKEEIEPPMILQSLIGEMLSRGLRAHDACICGSGRKYKRCHGTVLGS